MQRNNTWMKLKEEGQQLISDTSSLMQDTLSIVSDLEELKELVQRHWFELILDALCCVCCCGTSTEEHEPEEIRIPLTTGPRYLDFRKEPYHEYLD